jgi:hypothetical protein
MRRIEWIFHPIRRIFEFAGMVQVWVTSTVIESPKSLISPGFF